MYLAKDYGEKERLREKAFRLLFTTTPTAFNYIS
jgi:hypothetical protein